MDVHRLSVRSGRIEAEGEIMARNIDAHRENGCCDRCLKEGYVVWNDLTSFTSNKWLCRACYNEIVNFKDRQNQRRHQQRIREISCHYCGKIGDVEKVTIMGETYNLCFQCLRDFKDDITDLFVAMQDKVMVKPGKKDRYQMLEA